MKPYYRILRLNHGRAPTVQHATLKEAETEALRLAGQHPGETFEILECLGIARTTTPSIFWNDGVEPPVKRKRDETPVFSSLDFDDDEPAPPAYRMLEPGERIEEGDEFRHLACGSSSRPRELAPWEPVLVMSVGASLFRSNVGHYRRPIKKP